MRTITQNIKVELENDEKVTLNRARAILDNFLETMRYNHCSSVWFEDSQEEFSISEIQNATSLINILADENPTIE